ncbi:MAG: carboxypeptidase regulatory-like domain-containing protein, partial [Pseudomonadota bacterium]
MNKLTYAILLALGSANVNASTIAGTVTDQSGKPITDGFVSVDGSSIKAPISDDGTFLLSGLKLGEVTLHVASPNHIHEHSEFQLTANGIQDATIVVRDASIEVLDVSSVGLHVSTFEGILPATVLAGDKLNRRQDATLGDTLDDEVGVHSSAHGGVVSTPIIRGLSGPRVFIAQNGLDVSDV